MATILAHIQVKPGTEARFEEAARARYLSTHEHEENVRHYEYWRGQEPGHYYTLLAFDSYRDFLMHESSDYPDGASAGLGQSIAEIRLEWVDPVEGASPLPATKMQTVSVNASEVMQRIHDTMPAQVQPWWDELRGASD